MGSSSSPLGGSKGGGVKDLSEIRHKGMRNEGFEGVTEKKVARKYED